MWKEFFYVHRYNNSVKINLKKFTTTALGKKQNTTNIQTKQEMNKKAYQF